MRTSTFSIKICKLAVKVEKQEGTSQGFDPTAFCNHTFELAGIRVRLNQSWDTLGRYYVRGKEVLFTSPSIHPFLHKHITLRLERWIKENDPATLNQEEDPFGGHDPYYGHE